MEQKIIENITKSVTLKGLMIAILTLMLLIPGAMIQGLINERQYTKNEAVQKIDAKWSYAQTVAGPVLVIPYFETEDRDGKKVVVENTLNITPRMLNIEADLQPEERHYGIYKTILYRSKVVMRGNFSLPEASMPPVENIYWDRVYINLGLSDLRGISEEIAFTINGKSYGVHSSGKTDLLMNQVLQANIQLLTPKAELEFLCEMDLKGSGSINFIPLGQTTNVSISGEWQDPGFIGNYTPEYVIDESGFSAQWHILHYNRTIPDTWRNQSIAVKSDNCFGISLIDTVDIYQQNMRSVKYAILFIALTFVIFFFVELMSRRQIHIIQYLLVGVALILFYALLLSLSEPIGFMWAYVISSMATITLITVYSAGIFKNKKQTTILAAILAVLYVFLYIILQLKEMALLAGSVGLFVILGVIMYLSNRVFGSN